MLFRQLFDPESSTYTYLLADEETRHAAIIDPVREQTERDLALLRELGLKLTHILETHVHADHVTGASILREQTGARTVVSARAGAQCADKKAVEGDKITFGSCALHVLETPGHTDGCLTYVTADRKMAFTGDALLIRGCGRTDFQQGNPHKLFHSVREKIFSLPESTLIYPGHDYKGRTASTVGEERKFNARLSDSKSEEEFVEIMTNLKLAYPKKIQEAVPANMQCGRPSDGSQAQPSHAAEEPARAQAERWAPIERTAAGVPEVTTKWVEETYRKGTYRIVDVREPHELASELGAIPGALNCPLAELQGVLSTWKRDMNLILVCRSGGRSGTAATTAEKLGFAEVASMRGGMLAWQGERTRTGTS